MRRVGDTGQGENTQSSRLKSVIFIIHKFLELTGN